MNTANCNLQHTRHISHLLPEVYANAKDGVESGKVMARTGLRMMPTFPSPPLKFRTAGFPQYGFKAGLSEGAFPARRPIVAPIWFAALLRAPRFQPVRPRSVSGQLCA